MNSRTSLLTSIFITLVAFIGVSFKLSDSPEFGKVTYYANSFQGKKTANGELYDREKMTCAHKSLPFGTLVRVTRLDNQKSVEVRVNDRGPFAEGYVIDISYKAAEAIDLIQAGVAKVKVEVVEPASATKAVPSKSKVPEVKSSTGAPAQLAGARSGSEVALKKPSESNTATKPQPATATPKSTPKSVVAKPAPVETYQIDVKKIENMGFAVQLMSVENMENAVREAAKLSASFKNKVVLHSAPNENDPTTSSYKVLIGPFKTRKEAEAQQKVATKKGYKKCFIIELKD
jgi:rare lipoprotein A